MTSLQSIESFLDKRPIAFVGVPRDTKKFGYHVYRDMKNRGFELIPVNPNTDNINGETCYKDLASVPDGVEKVFIITPKAQTLSVLEQAYTKGIKQAWIQQTAETKEAIAFGSEKGMDLIHNECIMMFAVNTGIHKLHGFLKKVFGRYPK